MKKMITIMILMGLTVSLSAQIPEITWQQCYHGTNEQQRINCVAETGNGYMIGMSIYGDGFGVSGFHGGADAWVINVDTMGNIIWEKCFGGSDGDGGPYDIARSTDGNYYLFCSTGSSDGDVQSFNHGNGDFWIVKINGQGDIIWEKCYGTPYGDGPRDAIATPDGGLLFMGRIMSSGGDVQIFYGANDIWFCKIDPLGNIEWEKTIGNEGVDNALKLKLTSDSTFAFIGNFYETGGMIECQCDTLEYVKDVWLVEIDLEGNIVKQLCYGGSYYDLGYDFEKLEDGYILLASTQSNDGDVSGLHGLPGNPHYDDIWALKIDNSGELLWQRCLGGYSSETSNYIGQAKDGGFMVIGFTFSHDGNVSGNHSMPGGNDADIWAVKLSSEGEIEWQHCYGGWGNERFWITNSIVKKDENSYVILAQSDLTSDDVECNINQGFYQDAWLFEIKDCSQYPVGNIGAITGPDSTCTVYDSTNLYTISPASGAWYFEWQLMPEEAGTINGNGTEATITWNMGWEGTANIVARAMNDCDTSEWSEPYYTEVFTCLGLEELYAGNIKLKVYPNPARGFVIFELPKAAINNNPINKSSVISTPWAGQSTGRRNPPANMGPASKPQGKSIGSNGKGFPPSGRNDNGADMTVVIVDVFGQRVAQLPITSEKTVWDTEEVENGIYFYRVEVNGEVMSGKVVVQK